jgi:hypothetical protein
MITTHLLAKLHELRSHCQPGTQVGWIRSSAATTGHADCRAKVGERQTYHARLAAMHPGAARQAADMQTSNELFVPRALGPSGCAAAGLMNAQARV